MSAANSAAKPARRLTLFGEAELLSLVAEALDMESVYTYKAGMVGEGRSICVDYSAYMR